MRPLLNWLFRASQRLRLHPYDWALILPLMLGIGWSSVGLKLWRLSMADIQLRIWQVPLALRSELLVCLAFLLLAVALRTARLPTFLRRSTFVVLQLMAAALAVGNILGHYFHEATSSSLSWLILAHGWNVFWSSPEVIQSETPVSAWVQLTLSSVVIVGGPLLVRSLFLRRFGLPNALRTPSSLLVATLSAALATAAIAGATTPISWIVNPSLNRDQGLTLLLGAFEEAPESRISADGVAFETASLRLVRSSGGAPPNLVFVVLESTRASAVTPYNPKLETTPFINELVPQSLFFEDANSVIPHTSKALVAIHCGVPPRPRMAIKEAKLEGIPGRCLPDLLTAHGYHTGFFQSATKHFENRRGLVKNMGFRDFYPLESLDTDGFERANYFGYEDNIMLGKSEEWLKARLESRGKPFMATYLTLTPHHDYLAPKRYGRKRFHKKKKLNRYLNAVHYVDHFLKNLFEQYRRLGLYDSTLFVVVGDHGEAFGEHGRYQHDNVPYQEGIHIPLLIHDGRGKLSAKRVAHPTSQIDLAPMLADMLGFKVAGGSFSGAALSQLSGDRPIRFTCWYEKQCVGVRLTSGKFIHHFGHRPDEFFDLATDPEERENRIESFPGDVEAVKSELLDWIDSIELAYGGKHAAATGDEQAKKKKKKKGDKKKKKEKGDRKKKKNTRAGTKGDTSQKRAGTKGDGANTSQKRAGTKGDGANTSQKRAGTKGGKSSTSQNRAGTKGDGANTSQKRAGTKGDGANPSQQKNEALRITGSHQGASEQRQADVMKSTVVRVNAQAEPKSVGGAQPNPAPQAQQ